MPNIRTDRPISWSSVHLNAIRGAAALVVLLGHTRGLFFTSLTDKAETAHVVAYQHASRPTVGEAAVIVFFVLSGYLVGGSVLRSIAGGRWSWTDYLFKRITRLWVVLLPALALGAGLDVLGMHIIGNHASIYGAPASTLVPHHLASRLAWQVIAANACFLQGIVTPTAGTNNSLWSLAYEWWYYLMFPLAVLMCVRSTKLVLRVVYVLLLAGVAFFLGRDMMALFPAWLLGVAAAAMPAMTVPRIVTNTILATSMCFILLIKKFDMSYYGTALCVALASALVLWSAIQHKGTCNNERYKRASSFFSDISYTLYLVHLPLAIFICAIVNRPWHYRTLTPINALLFLLMNAAIVLAAYLFYRLFEKNTDAVRGFLASLRIKQRAAKAAGSTREAQKATNVADSKLAVTAYD